MGWDSGVVPTQTSPAGPVGEKAGTGLSGPRHRMDDLSRYAQRPLGFYLRYVRLRPVLHSAILLAGFAAAICAVATQYKLKFLVDALSGVANRRDEV